jgi:uncharacterized protein (DUF1499 family)
MVVLKWVLIGLLVVVLAAVLAGQLGLLRGQAPQDLGVRDGKLKPPSRTPNSVSSQADLWPTHAQHERARIAPLALVGGDGAATMARLQAVIRATPGAVVVTAREDYLYAQFSTRLMKFTDDAEFWLDRPAGVVQVRSASRLGEGDLGANRARVEAIRARLAGGRRLTADG